MAHPEHHRCFPETRYDINNCVSPACFGSLRHLRGLAPISAQKNRASYPPRVQGSWVQFPKTVLGMDKRVTATIWDIRSSLIMPFFASSVPFIAIRRAAPL